MSKIPKGKYCNHHTGICPDWFDNDKCKQYPDVELEAERETLPENGDYTGYIIKCPACLSAGEEKKR